MKLIAHRGNITGPNPEQENQFIYLYNAVTLGYDVSVDIWIMDGEVWTGHDSPTYKLDWNQLYKLKINGWFHCKNLEAFTHFTGMQSNKQYYNWNYFWHQNDDFALTSNHYIWTYPNKNLGPFSIAVLIDGVKNEYTEKDLTKCHGICSDYVKKIKENLNA